MRGRRAVLAALAALAAVAVLAFLAATTTAIAQDTSATLRHLLPLNLSRVQPFRRTYDMVVLSGDSSIRVGQRDVALQQATLADSSVGWLLTESRTGLVQATDSLFLAPDLRPVDWSSTLGATHASLDFRNDSAVGSARSPAGSVAMAFGSPPDLILSGAMLDVIAAALPLSSEWSDSVSVLSADLAGVDIVTAELLVIGEDTVPADSAAARPCWLLALRSDSHQLLLWVDKEHGAVTRMQQTLPPHAGTLLEYRERRVFGGAAPH